MSLFRTTTTTILSPTARRALSTSSLLNKSVTEALKDAARAVDQTAAKAALRGLEAAEHVRDRTRRVVGSAVRGRSGKAKEYTGDAAGRVSEAAGRTAGAAKGYTSRASEVGRR